MTTPEQWYRQGVCYANAATKVQKELLNEISNLKHGYAIVSAQRNELLVAARQVEAHSHVNADGSYTVDAPAMDAICKVIGRKWAKAGGRAQ